MNSLSVLLAALAGIYSSEGRPGGELAAEELLKASTEPCDLPTQTAPPLAVELEETLVKDSHPLSPIIRQVNPLLHWIYSDLNGRIRNEISSRMMQTELVGPDGIFLSEKTRVGLWVQTANLNYTTRTHAAEETFVILGGKAIWQAGDNAPLEEGIGTVIHHPSNTPHSNCTTNSPLLAAWRWSGDISIEQYTLKG